MAETITLSGADGFEFSAYHEQAMTPHKGGVIVIQEIFGIDKHVRVWGTPFGEKKDGK